MEAGEDVARLEARIEEVRAQLAQWTDHTAQARALEGAQGPFLLRSFYVLVCLCISRR